MVQRIQLKYSNMQIGIVSWREVYLLRHYPKQLLVEEKTEDSYTGEVIFKADKLYTGTKGLIRTDRFIEQNISSWL
jgi:hypothetical protein